MALSFKFTTATNLRLILSNGINSEFDNQMNNDLKVILQTCTSMCYEKILITPLFKLAIQVRTMTVTGFFQLRMKINSILHTKVNNNKYNIILHRTE